MFVHQKEYVDEIKLVANSDYNWREFYNKSILITGATGLIGTFLVDLFMYKNVADHTNISVFAMSRSEHKARARFDNYFGNDLFNFIEHDINNPLKFENDFDFIIHGASNTHPIAYATDPVGTISTNILGTMNILNYASQHIPKRIVYLSTVEIYGENEGDVDKFDEEYLGYINCNTLRAGYPESKRTGEALCQAFISKFDLDIVIPRLCRVYGPTMQDSDSKALAQFIKNAVNSENIVLKSEGKQEFSYIYVVDAVSAILNILIKGKKGEAYNVADEYSDVKLKYVAEILAKISNKRVVFELPNEIETKGFSTASKALLDSKKLKQLGWNAKYNISDGLNNTVTILKGLTKNKFADD